MRRLEIAGSGTVHIPSCEKAIELAFPESNAGFIWMPTTGAPILRSVVVPGDRMGGHALRVFTINVEQLPVTVEFSYKRPWEDSPIESRSIVLDSTP